MDKIFQDRKKYPVSANVKFNSIFKVTSVRIKTIKEAPPPPPLLLYGRIKEIWVESVSSREDRRLWHHWKLHPVHFFSEKATHRMKLH
jgi:hypothetical protein